MAEITVTPVEKISLNLLANPNYDTAVCGKRDSICW